MYVACSWFDWCLTWFSCNFTIFPTASMGLILVCVCVFFLLNEHTSRFMHGNFLLLPFVSLSDSDLENFNNSFDSSYPLVRTLWLCWSPSSKNRVSTAMFDIAKRISFLALNEQKVATMYRKRSPDVIKQFEGWKPNFINALMHTTVCVLYSINDTS